MKIILLKGKNRNTLSCIREDGTLTRANLGPGIPNHDIAHYVVETNFNLKNGFFGKIKSGMSIEDLSDKEIIAKLESETWLSEILARNLQSIGSGAVKADEFIKLVYLESQNGKRIEVPNMTFADVQKMIGVFNQLCQEWKSIPENENLNLIVD